MKSRIFRAIIMFAVLFMLIGINGCGKEKVSEQSTQNGPAVKQSGSNSATSIQKTTPTSAPKITPTSTPSTNKKSTPTPTATSTPAPMIDSFMEDCIKLGSKGKLLYNGKEWYAVYGTNKALIYRYVEATFDEKEHYVFDIIRNYSDQVKKDRYSICPDGKLYASDFEAVYCGEDVFCIITSDVNYCLYAYSISGWGDGTNSIMFSWKTTASRITPFYNERAFFKDDDRMVYLLSKSGEIKWKYKNLNIQKGIALPDENGIFYCDNCFYDPYLNVMLDMNKLGLGEPVVDWAENYVFEGDICPMVTEKNGKMWAFYIDIKGNVVSEIAEFKSGIFDNLTIASTPFSIAEQNMLPFRVIELNNSIENSTSVYETTVLSIYSTDEVWGNTSVSYDFGAIEVKKLETNSIYDYHDIKYSEYPIYTSYFDGGNVSDPAQMTIGFQLSCVEGADGRLRAYNRIFSPSGKHVYSFALDGFRGPLKLEYYEKSSRYLLERNSSGKIVAFVDTYGVEDKDYEYKFKVYPAGTDEYRMILNGEVLYEEFDEKYCTTIMTPVEGKEYYIDCKSGTKIIDIRGDVVAEYEACTDFNNSGYALASKGGNVFDVIDEDFNVVYENYITAADVWLRGNYFGAQLNSGDVRCFVITSDPCYDGYKRLWNK